MSIDSIDILIVVLDMSYSIKSFCQMNTMYKMRHKLQVN